MSETRPPAMRYGEATELDLDAGHPPSKPWRPHALVILLAIALLGAGAGAGLRARAQPVPDAADPIPAARLTLRDARLDASPTGAVATLRLVVRGNGQQVHLGTLVIHGGGLATTITLDRTVPAGDVIALDLETKPDCTQRSGPLIMSARLTIDPGDSTTGLRRVRMVTVVPGNGLDRAGGLCQAMDLQLPGGWRRPVTASNIQHVGPDLRVTLTGLGDDSRLAGVWAGDALLADREHTGPAAPGDARTLLLVHPGECGTGPVARQPTGLRVLTIGKTGLRVGYAAIGPALARWLGPPCRPGYS